MIVRFVLVVSCAALVILESPPAHAAPQPPAPPQRILVVGDSTAETFAPFLRDAAAAKGVQVFSAAVVGCSVIDGQPVLDDGRPYVDVVGDTRRCPGTTESAQSSILATQHPDTIVWMSGWEAWSNRVLDGQVVHFGTIAGNRAILAHIDAAVNRLTAGGARVVFLPVAPNAYPSVRGAWNGPGDLRLAVLARMLRAYAREHTDKVSLIDLPVILCPSANGSGCPAEVAPGIRPRNLDGFHFDGDGAAWLASQLTSMLLGTEPPPASPVVPTCAPASVGSGLGAAGRKCS
jgi:hypothetical protein